MLSTYFSQLKFRGPCCVSKAISDAAMAMKNGSIASVQQTMRRVALALDTVDIFEVSEQLQSLRDGALALSAQLEGVTVSTVLLPASVAVDCQERAAIQMDCMHVILISWCSVRLGVMEALRAIIACLSCNQWKALEIQMYFSYL